MSILSARGEIMRSRRLPVARKGVPVGVYWLIALLVSLLMWVGLFRLAIGLF